MCTGNQKICVTLFIASFLHYGSLESNQEYLRGMPAGSCCGCSVAKLCTSLCDPVECSTPGSSILHNLLEMFIESVMLSKHLIVCSLFSSYLVFPRIRVFSIESALHIMWPKYWSFNFSINPSNEYSGLISFRVFWFDRLAVQGTLESLPQYHSFQKHQFFSVQPSLWPNSLIHT